ncbi:hypothetical protein TNIN_209101 [Trichonephila inaurata madagascariensis]|uniref:Uncharacterized protein n=1 Tax=Trichonephila inaurata madagascariensis TaxID=2747483 RepID=A0A8X6MK47_9ARAC|nr:hypothetical protein TNIN_209101 [Trichonephila inaurata madagascariensis]
MKGRRRSTSNIDRWSSLRLKPQEDGTHEVSTFLPDQRDNRVSKAREWSPKRAFDGKWHLSLPLKTKKIKGIQVLKYLVQWQMYQKVEDILQLQLFQFENPHKWKNLYQM